MKQNWKKYVKGLICCFLFVLFFCGNRTQEVKAAATTPLTIEATLDKTGARGLYDAVREYRLNEDEVTNKDMIYDYNLERIAIQRAYEIALVYDVIYHYRPNGEHYSTLLKEQYGKFDELIEAGHMSMADAMDVWKTWSSDYDCDGERVYMASNHYTAMGAAHVIYHGYDFWVLELANSALDLTPTPAGVYDQTVTIDVLEKDVHTIKQSYEDKWGNPLLIIYEMEDAYVEDLHLLAGVEGQYCAKCQPLADEVYVTVDDSSVVSLSAEDDKGYKYKVTGLKAGETDVWVNSKNVPGRRANFHVVVEEVNGGTMSDKNPNFRIEDIPDYKYTGAEICPKVKVYYYNKLLVEGKDYKLGYFDNVKAGTAEVRVVGCGKYLGYCSKKFNIIGIPIEEATIEVPNAFYTGKYVCPRPIVTYKGRNLTDHNEVGWKYENNIEKGTGTVVILAKEMYGYVGSTKVTFNIVDKTLYDAEIDVIPVQIYTGKEVKPKVTVKYKKTQVLTEGKDYKVVYRDNIEKGRATVEVIGIGGYADFTKRGFSIEEEKQDSFFIYTIKPSSAIYTGKEIRPQIEVRSSMRTLKEGTDYQVKYLNNINPGEATIVVTGIGKFSGTVKETFEIEKINIEDQVTVKPIKEAYNYTGKKIEPKLQLVYDGKVLEEGRDYTVSYENNIKPGVAKVYYEATSDGIFEDYGYVEFKILPTHAKTLKLSKNKITIKKSVTYKLKATITPEVTNDRIKFVSSNPRVASVSSKGVIRAKKKGTAKITVTIGSIKKVCRVTVKP